MTVGDLAIDGGRPVRDRPIPYARQCITDDDVAAVSAALRSDWLTTGPLVDALESAVASRVGARHAVAVSSGTAALHLATFAAGIGAGDEVVVPALTFAASANCVLYVGARPVFADVRSDSLCIDPAAVERAIGPRTRAIVAVDYAGQPADLAELRALADAHGLTLIEDAAHALGATYRGRPVGAISHLTTFSFHPVKHVTTGEGGLLACDDEESARRARRFRNHGIATDHRERAARGEWLYEMVDLGFNYRLPDINCALGLSQLGRLDAWLARRRDIVDRYRTAFADEAAVRALEALPDREPAWHLYPVRIDSSLLRVDRRQVFAALRAEGIGVNVHYVPVYWHPYYRSLGYERGLCPEAEAAYERLVTLPLFPAMTDDDVFDVIAAVEKVIAAYRR